MIRLTLIALLITGCSHVHETSIVHSNVGDNESDRGHNPDYDGGLAELNQELLKKGFTAPSHGPTEVSILGIVSEPGVYNINRGSRLGDLILLAGGYSSHPYPGHCRIARSEGDAIKPKDRDAWNPFLNIELQDGDLAFIGDEAY